MHDGMVHSCNAYFGQLAVRLGPEPLVETADRLGISLTPSRQRGRRRARDAPAGRLWAGGRRGVASEDGAVAAAVAAEGVLA